MIASDPPANPVLRELAALQNDIDVDPDPEQTQFEYCRTRARSTQNRCRRSISKKDAFSSKEDQINSLLASFNNLMECPKDATFYDNIEEFLVTTHCRQHYDRYLSPRFLEWKERRSREPSILSNEDGATNNNGTTKSISEPDSKPPSINLDKESRPGEALEKVPLASRVENVIEDVPEMRIATNNQHENSGVDDIRIDEEIHNIMGLGLANLKRSGSLRDGSPIIREIYEPITLEQSAQGTVHVLEHQEIQGLFKIGWTGGDTSSSLHQAYNCYGTATKMIHETSEGPFYGAYKAQRLAQVFLRHHNLSVARCEKCGQEHGEWFKTSEERICDTVKLMESFVRLPGYTLQDGLMKVSPRADRIVKAMCSVSPETLAGCMAKEEGPTEADIGANEMSDVVTTTTVTKTTVVTESSYNIVNKVHPRSHSSSLVGPDQANKGLGHHKKPVNHCLLALPGVKKEQLKRILSHPQALSQCENNLIKLGVVRENVDDTAGAAQFVASNGLRDTGAVASARAAEIYGLNILADRIQDDADNITRFLIFAREPIMPRTDRPFKTSIVFTLDEGPGVMFKALAVFALRDINLTKIESRPQRKLPLRVVDDSNTGTAKYFDYLFYVDFEASMAEPRAQNALGHLQEFATFLRVLGCYPMDISPP